MIQQKEAEPSGSGGERLSSLERGQVSPERLRHVSNFIQVVLHELVRKDDRFLYIQTAFENFLDEPFSLNDQGSKAYLSTSEYAKDALKLGVEGQTMIKSDAKCRPNLKDIIIEFINLTTFELFNVFDIEIIPEHEQLQENLEARFDLLTILYEKYQNLEPPPIKQGKQVTIVPNSEERYYEYPTVLDPAIGQVRILEILGGTEGDPIECHLIVCNLHEDGIPEALSYVWGNDNSTSLILIDQKPFPVKTNLHGILRGLRRQDTTRRIWIDAICIDQSNSKEKTHQVRLMRHIYSRAKNTIIWLSGDRSAYEPTVNQPCTPVHAESVGATIGEDDFIAMFEEFRSYSRGEQWDRKRCVLCRKLLPYISEILSYEWWERMWTIQEAVLPSPSPIIVFQGHSISLDDLLRTIEAIRDLVSERNIRRVNKHPAARVSLLIRRILRFEWARPDAGIPTLLCNYRLGLKKRRYGSPYTFGSLLYLTGSYRSTDPRDKIFALESLLPKSLGLLIRVDYEEDYQTVFKRATARAYNIFSIHMFAIYFKFLFESRPLAPTTPSWVLDFAYSDVDVHQASRSVKRQQDLPVTLDQFIEITALGGASYADHTGTFFATQRTLFCTGRHIDQIYLIGTVPMASDDERGLGILGDFLRAVHKERKSVLRTFAGGKTKENPNMTLKQKRLPSTPHLFDLFLLGDVGGTSDDSFLRHKLVSYIDQFQEIAGKQYFISKKGVVGIATAPIVVGDSLFRPNKFPVNWIIREAENGDGIPNTTQEHRIVARAAIQNEDLNLPSLSKDVPYRLLRFV